MLVWGLANDCIIYASGVLIVIMDVDSSVANKQRFLQVCRVPNTCVWYCHAHSTSCICTVRASKQHWDW